MSEAVSVRCDGPQCEERGDTHVVHSDPRKLSTPQGWKTNYDGQFHWCSNECKKNWCQSWQGGC